MWWYTFKWVVMMGDSEWMVCMCVVMRVYECCLCVEVAVFVPAVVGLVGD